VPSAPNDGVWQASEPAVVMLSESSESKDLILS
jgi:hypothetical protein